MPDRFAEQRQSWFMSRAEEIHLAASHGVLCGPAVEKLREAPD